jgi:hypothetical protein
VKVVLAGVPVALHQCSVQHISDLRHELLIVRAGEEAGQRDHDSRLAKLLDDIDPDGVAGAAGRAQSEAARAEGRDTVDLELDLSPDAAPSCVRMVAALEEADELCRELELLTLAAPPEVAGFRRWVVAEVAGQLTDGRPPEPFAG